MGGHGDYRDFTHLRFFAHACNKIDSAFSAEINIKVRRRRKVPAQVEVRASRTAEGLKAEVQAALELVAAMARTSTWVNALKFPFFKIERQHRLTIERFRDCL
jgi:hypothetical protein